MKDDAKKFGGNTNTPLICDDGFDVKEYIEWKNKVKYFNSA